MWRNICARLTTHATLTSCVQSQIHRILLDHTLSRKCVKYWIVTKFIISKCSGIIQTVIMGARDYQRSTSETLLKSLIQRTNYCSRVSSERISSFDVLRKSHSSTACWLSGVPNWSYLLQSNLNYHLYYNITEWKSKWPLGIPTSSFRYGESISNSDSRPVQLGVCIREPLPCLPSEWYPFRRHATKPML